MKPKKVTIEDLAKDLESRLKILRADRNIHTIGLKDKDPREMIVYSFGHVIKGLERKASLVDMSVTLGRRVRQRFGLKRDSVGSCHVGWFILISFIEKGLIQHELKNQKTKRGRNSKYRTYFMKVKDKKALFDIWDDILEEEEIDLFPVKEPMPDWESGYHSEGFSIVKKASAAINSKFNKEEHGFLFDTLNKLNGTAWTINPMVLEVYSWYFDNRADRSPFKHHNERNQEKRESFFIEANAIRRLAEKHRGNLFYHLYNFDFRGRIYSNTAFLHEQGSDQAKGLLTLAKAKPLGDRGFYWLCVYAANNWGYDKENLDRRVDYTLENYETFVSYARDPYSNNGWMDADKPWCFLACCYELMLLQQWVDEGNEQEEFISGLPVYIDGSNNGLQHLTAISRDTEMAKYVNLVPLKKVGDIYSFVAEKVWARLEEREKALPEEVVSQFDEVLATAVKLQREYEDAPLGSEQKANAYEAVQTWRNNNRKLREQLFPVFWNRVKNLKQRRKICKRGTMTVPYGATSYGMGQQIVEDTKSISDYLAKQETLWAVQFGKLLHETCYEELEGPAQFLQFFESIAEEYNERGEHLSWRSPITNFPVVQNYKKPVSNRTKLRYGDQELYVVVENWDDATLNKERQRQGTSPNFVHSLDAVHLSMIVHDSPFTVTVVHDSFGCVAADMNDLFEIVRIKFVELYRSEPLDYICSQLNFDSTVPERGRLDVSDVLDSEFAFA